MAKGELNVRSAALTWFLLSIDPFFPTVGSCRFIGCDEPERDKTTLRLGFLSRIETDRGAGDFQKDAEFLLVKIRMKKLMSSAKDRPLLANQTAKSSTKDFLKAFDYEELQRYDDALTCYNKILRQLSAEPLESRHVYLAALQRKQALLELPSNQAGQSESLPVVPPPIRFQPDLPSSGEKSLFQPIEENGKRILGETATG